MALFFLRKNKVNYIKVFFVYTILLALFIIPTFYSIYSINSRATYLFTVRIYFCVEYAMLMLFFSLLLKNKIVGRIALFSIILFVLYSIYNFFTSKPNTFNNYPALLDFFVLIIVLLYYFFEKMRVVTKNPLYQSISFWICVGLFIHFTGNLFYFIFINSTNDDLLKSQMQVIYSCVTIAKNLILAFAWFANERIETDSDILQIPDNMQLDDDFIVSKQINS